MNYALQLSILSVFALPAIQSQIYYVTPQKGVIEYRGSFVRTSVTKEKTVYGNSKKSYLKFEETELIEKHQHFPAGLYYVNSDKAYNVSAGRNILYSIFLSSDGDKYLCVWRQHPAVNQEIIAQDAEKCYDTQLARTAIGTIVGGLVGAYFGISDAKHIAAAVTSTLIGATIGRACSPSDKDRLIEEEYLPKESLTQVIEQMDKAGDNRASALRAGTQTYVLESVLPTNSIQSARKAHIDDFVIEPATAEDIERAKKGNHATDGALAYSLPTTVTVYNKESIKDRLTLFAAVKRWLGLRQ